VQQRHRRPVDPAAPATQTDDRHHAQQVLHRVDADADAEVQMTVVEADQRLVVLHRTDREDVAWRRSEADQPDRDLAHAHEGDDPSRHAPEVEHRLRPALCVRRCVRGHGNERDVRVVGAGDLAQGHGFEASHGTSFCTEAYGFPYATVRIVATSRLPRSAWIDAASREFAENGLAGVRVELLARRLGVTKGSFYWHFTDRQALVDAVVGRWETEQTNAVIERTEAAATEPRARLAALFHDVARQAPHRRGERHLYLEAAGEHVEEAVRRVTHRRTEFVASLLVELGHPADDAARRATAAVAAAVGLAQVAPFGSGDAASAEALTRTLLAMTIGD
jgi:AcrR family transcriptional regulator